MGVSPRLGSRPPRSDEAGFALPVPGQRGHPGAGRGSTLSSAHPWGGENLQVGKLRQGNDSLVAVQRGGSPPEGWRCLERLVMDLVPDPVWSWSKLRPSHAPRRTRCCESSFHLFFFRRAQTWPGLSLQQEEAESHQRGARRHRTPPVCPGATPQQDTGPVAPALPQAHAAGGSCRAGEQQKKEAG